MYFIAFKFCHIAHLRTSNLIFLFCEIVKIDTFQMVTWSPERKIKEDNEIESDDCEVTMQLLPMRCIIDQRAISFIRAFFNSSSSDDDDDENGDETKEKWSSGLHLVPPPRFRSFRVKPWKLKVDYIPRKMDIAALREGSLVELVNVSPIDGMVITLSQVNVLDVVGGGDALHVTAFKRCFGTRVCFLKIMQCFLGIT